MQKTIFTCMTAHQANIQEAKQQGALYKIIARNKNEGKVSLSSLRTSIYMGKKKTPNQVYSFTELEFDSKHKKLKEYPDELMQKTQFKSQVGISKFRK